MAAPLLYRPENANDDNLFSVELSLEMINKVSHLKIEAGADGFRNASAADISSF